MERPNFFENGILRLPPGFRFHPTDEELVVHYLRRKVQSLPLFLPIPEADVCRSDPWNLPGNCEQERYFFSIMEMKYPNRKRSNRTAKSGYWKPSGLAKQVVDSRIKQVIGTKKTLVFYTGKSPKGVKTNWIMHEYTLSKSTQGMENWVICRVFLKKIPRNGEQRINFEKTGAIFHEFSCDRRMIDLNLDDGRSSSSCLSGITVADEDDDDDDEEENSKLG